ncbi:Dehydrogenase/reductase SDR family member 12 [Symbiodinium microadriaticum]|uniref:Dehydrogenase/reductase SDR family member 12 n=1 Tax=Symbiodinium microadriaticum TaxID=2951 RepID=A0A1Q9DAM6_SYMMI|nr:Dehydrogenase/reductase SDR family member 12 [Symbiodinium microadriaticum]
MEPKDYINNIRANKGTPDQVGADFEIATSTQFYLYGKRHFTSSGWEMHQASYAKPDLLESALSLAGRVYIVTGSNSGIGKEIAQFLATKGATVYMLCRSQQRAENARADIVAKAGGDAEERVHILLADCSLETEVRRCWDDFCEHSIAKSGDPTRVRLDGLVCNAGALANTKTMTAEGIELTFASHLLFGTYLLGSLAMPVLEATEGSRLIVVSSGGMYNTAFPKWEDATSTGTAKYDGQFAYAYAKRGQVLLCEQWAELHPKVKVVSCHPGWTSTPAVDEAYGSSKSYLEPMRNTWQGAEGIIWLCVTDASAIEPGAFYLDREPQVKHMGGRCWDVLGGVAWTDSISIFTRDSLQPDFAESMLKMRLPVYAKRAFFTEGTITKNSPGEVADMMRLLEDWANGRRDTELRVASAPLAAMTTPIDLERFMGTWYVIANIPTFFDRGTTHNVENYTLDDGGRVVHVDFTYRKAGSGKPGLLQQRAEVVNDACTQWAISPKLGVFLPLRIAYLVADCAEDYSTTIIGVPDKSYIWIMARTPTVDQATYDALLAKARSFGYDTSSILRVSQE